MQLLNKTVIAAAVLFFAAGTGKAQLFDKYNFKFKTYTTTDGLAHNSVKKCVSDSKGFLWIATENGLSRFDGYQFKNYRNIFNDSTSLPENNLWDMAITDRDEIFLAYKFGLCSMNPSTGRFTVIKYKNKNIAAQKIAFHKPSGAMFAATQNGLLKYNIQTREVTATSLSRAFQDKVTNLAIDKQNKLWVLIERHGYYRYDINRDTSFYYNSYDWPMHLYQDDKGVYYMGTWASGFQVFDNIKGEHQKKGYTPTLPEVPGNNYIFCGAEEAPLLTGDDIIWVATNTSGLALFSKPEQQFVKNFGYKPSLKYGISTPFNWSMFTAPDGTLWIGTWHGLMKVSRLNQYFQNAELPELQSNYYNALTGIMDDPAEKNIAWAAVLGSGIVKYNKQENKMIQRYYFDDLNVSSWYQERWPVYFFKDSNQVIWSGSYGGMIRINKGQVSFVPLTDSGRSSYAESGTMDSKGNIWQTGRYIIQFNPYTGKTVSWKFPFIKQAGLYSYGVCEGADRKMYIASEWGLLTVDTKNNTTGRINFTVPPADSAKWSAVYSVMAVGDDIYIGTSAGLAAYNIRTRQTTVVGAEQGLRPILKNALYGDKKDNVWIYCSNGLFRYNPATKDLLQFTTADGVYAHSNDPAYFFEYNGNTYLGSRMAYTRFNPDYISSNTNRPVPYITSVTVNGGTRQEAALQGHLRLNYRQRNISFDFTAIEYNFPEKITFSIMLEGFDDEWSPPSASRTKNYTNLPPGKYVFKVKAYNNNRQGDAVASFAFRITPAFWQTRLFKAAAVLLLAGMLVFAWRRRIAALRNKQRQREQVQQLELEQFKQQLELEQVTAFFSGALLAKNSVPEVLSDVAKNLIGRLGFEDCMIYLWNDDKTLLLQHAGHGKSGAIEHKGDIEKYHIPRGKGIIGAAVDNKKPLLVNDVTADPRYIFVDETPRLSELCVPLMDEGETLGAINIEHSERGFFTSRHLQTVSTIAALVVNKIKAIESAQNLHNKELELAATSRQLAESELSLLRSQMNPHFIFNSLNSIQKYIWENKEEDAAEYLASFARLMRLILENSRYAWIPISQEMVILKLYIDLEHRRSNQRFDYQLKAGTELDLEHTLIPPMLLQPFIENAIWHGLNKKAGRGHLLVTINRQHGQLVCVVEDDGVGRQQGGTAAIGKKSLGIEITRQRIERLMAGKGEAATITITDKMEQEQPAGTKVTVVLPVQMKAADEDAVTS